LKSPSKTITALVTSLVKHIICDMLAHAVAYKIVSHAVSCWSSWSENSHHYVWWWKTPGWWYLQKHNQNFIRYFHDFCVSASA